MAKQTRQCYLGTKHYVKTYAILECCKLYRIGLPTFKWLEHDDKAMVACCSLCTVFRIGTEVYEASKLARWFYIDIFRKFHFIKHKPTMTTKRVHALCLLLQS